MTAIQAITQAHLNILFAIVFGSNRVDSFYVTFKTLRLNPDTP